jgi:hypothetical protein
LLTIAEVTPSALAARVKLPAFTTVAYVSISLKRSISEIP